jgi:MscS family membrane protein
MGLKQVCRSGVLLASVVAFVAISAGAQVQSGPGAPTPQAPAADALGRSTPRGTVLGFLTAARRAEYALARQYLDTPYSGERAETLAHQLFVVLDARLPARLTQISDAPEGTRTNPLTPDQDVVGTIRTATGSVDIVVTRVDRGTAGSIWLFSRTTLDATPGLYAEVAASQGESVLPQFLTSTRIWRVRLVDWLAVLLGIPAFYLATVLLNRLLMFLTRPVWRRLFAESSPAGRNVLPLPARLLLLALVGRWLLSSLPLSLAVRQFWTHATTLMMIAAVVWMLVLLDGEIEQYIKRHVLRANVAAASSLLRLFRRAVDLLVIFVGLLLALKYFGVDPTPALAGLGVGGIAVALAAQKTLENVVAGASLIFDQAVRVGDFLKMGDTAGIVDHIGLRSTRIRTLDRTVVSIPNGQIANVSLETLSARDKYWFHPIVGLRYETTPGQLRAVVSDIRKLLGEHRSVEPGSVRVRFFRLGSFSLDVDISAYLYARDWNHFLEIQEELLFGVMDAVARAGTEIAFPSQTMYVANAPRAGTPSDSSVTT